tara:strand:- start:79 stop:288 length:210 start_codon:yes stop_codon:yes gene_type:complete
VERLLGGYFCGTDIFDPSRATKTTMTTITAKATYIYCWLKPTAIKDMMKQSINAFANPNPNPDYIKIGN